MDAKPYGIQNGETRKPPTEKPGDSIRDPTFIPYSWRSRFTFEFGSRGHSPSQKGHVRRIAR